MFLPVILLINRKHDSLIPYKTKIFIVKLKQHSLQRIFNWGHVCTTVFDRVNKKLTSKQITLL